MARDLVRWGIMSTANIVRGSFLPALAATGEGEAYAVAGRDGVRAGAFAHANGIGHSAEGYETLLEDDTIEAIYIPLPNSLHAEWTIAALRAGKPVLCEKPMCVSMEETRSVLDVAAETGTPLWEAFVFPFHRQMTKLRDLLAEGKIGEVREVQATFHFTLQGRDDIRLSKELAGGALNDVGCYCVALACQVFSADPVDGSAVARWTPEEIDEEAAGVLRFSDERRLVLSCAMNLPQDTCARIIGTEGEIRVTNPYHPHEGDWFEVCRCGDSERFQSEQGEPSFTPALEHIQRVIRNQDQPRHLALEDAMAIARGLEILHQSAKSGRLESA
jgi:predicted dehydrogenase